MINYQQWKSLVLAEPFQASMASREAFDSRFTMDPKIIADYWAKHPDEREAVLHALTTAVMDQAGLVGFVLDNTTGRFAFLPAPASFSDGSYLIDGYYPDIDGMMALMRSEKGVGLGRWGMATLAVLVVSGIYGATLFLGKGRR